MNPKETEMDKLKDRLFSDPDRKFMNFNVFWGDEAESMTIEERAEALNVIFDAIKRGDYKECTTFEDDRPQINIRDFVKGL